MKRGAEHEGQANENTAFSVFKGSFPEPLLFTPKTIQGVEVIGTHPDMDSASKSLLDEMIGVFNGTRSPTRPYFQLPRMGRLFLASVSPPGEGFIGPKGGLGLSPGSESVRKLMEQRWRSLFGEDAGVLRVRMNEDRSFFIQYMPSNVGETFELFGPMPEGHVLFQDLLGEYRTLQGICEPLGIRSPKALALLKSTAPPLPWSTTQKAKQFLSEQFLAQLPPERHSVSIKVDPSYHPVTDLDSGLLFRQFRGAVRPQDLYDLALAGDWGKVRKFYESTEDYPELMMNYLAKTGGQFIQNGIILGQLYYDYQNITTAGEVCDTDRIIVAPSVNPELALKHTSQLRQDEKTFNLDIMNSYNERLTVMAPNDLVTAKSLVEQSYYLWDAALRCVDIGRRAVDGTSSPGTVLSENEIDTLRQKFCRDIASNVGERGRRVIQTACTAEIDIDSDFRTFYEPPLLKFYLDRGLATIQGWTKQDKPFNHFNHKTTEEDIAYIVQDYLKFQKTLLHAVAR